MTDNNTSNTPAPKKRKTILWIVLGAIASVLIVGVVIGSDQYRYRFSAAVAEEGYLYVPSGADLNEVMDSLTGHGFLAKPERFRHYAGQKNLDERLKAGRYKLTDGMSYRALINRLVIGDQAPVNLTFNNIRTLDRLAAAASRYIEADSVELVSALTNRTNAEKYGFTPETFIGMFIPNTYQFYWNTSAEGFMERMKSEYDRFWTAERDAKREKLGLSRDEVSTLASIVAEETVKADEMPRVAGVYINRLKINMPLQADPTVKFAVGDFTLRRILFKHLEVDSPYNTYKYSGLPPGPICVPPIRAIDAVLDHEDHSYLYFCAKEDFSGYHNFARTLAEHNRNARIYQDALNRRGIR